MKQNLLIVFFMAGMLSGCGSERHSQVSRAAFRSTVDGKATDLYTLRNARGLEMTVTNFGGRVVELWVPDRDGNFADIVLGHDNLGAYVDQTGERFLGATIGRYGNRIAAGRFTLDGKEYTLPQNDGPNSLHGGAKGFDMVVWDVVEVTPQKIVLACLSPDGDQGYPGNLKVTMTYELTDDNSFVITHEAATDRRTVVNLTHHSFFNLHGAGGPPINDHELMIAADFFTPVDSTLIPTGRLMPVEGTPMDFRRPAPIGSRLDADFEQLRHGHGYDHNWVLSRRSTHDLELAATVYEPAAGRYMEVWTTEPGIQFYGGNFFDGSLVGKGGKSYGRRASLALETQHFPDSPNHPGFPSTVLGPGQRYRHVCVYKFSTR
ncbi:MAG: aldose epimerase family protein [Alistipes onderdonkii]